MTPKVPVMQGGMGVGISLSKLASAVANAGGIGIISGTGISVDEMRAHIRKAKNSIKQGYIGVNVLFAMNDFAEKMKAALEEKVDFIISGAGISRDMYAWGKKAGIPVISIVSSAKLARISERLGAAAVVVEGFEAGGHLGTDQPLFDILPEVVEKLDKKLDLQNEKLDLQNEKLQEHDEKFIDIDNKLANQNSDKVNKTEISKAKLILYGTIITVIGTTAATIIVALIK
jgi:NAD(P)H-dependent flavin oxidoreductase YrpB (nitropropane dioxygenase family)